MHKYLVEFCGFFWGEGSMFIVPVKDKRRPGLTPRYRPEMTISLRDDDAEIINWLQRLFGGRVYYYENKRSKTKAKPTAKWTLRNCREILKVIDVLENGVMPSKKMLEIPVMKKFCQIKLNGPKGRVPWSDGMLKKQKSLYLELKSLKRYH